jgi:hypothetical protein
VEGANIVNDNQTSVEFQSTSKPIIEAEENQIFNSSTTSPIVQESIENETNNASIPPHSNPETTNLPLVPSSQTTSRITRTTRTRKTTQSSSSTVGQWLFSTSTTTKNPNQITDSLEDLPYENENTASSSTLDEGYECGKLILFIIVIKFRPRT